MTSKTASRQTNDTLDDVPAHPPIASEFQAFYAGHSRDWAGGGEFTNRREINRELFVTRYADGSGRVSFSNYVLHGPGAPFSNGEKFIDLHLDPEQFARFWFGLTDPVPAPTDR
jgi:hypothetical protein